MIEKTSIIKIISIFTLSFIFIVGCSTHRNLLNEEKYSVKELNTQDLKIELTDVHAEKDSFVISGKIRRIPIFNYHAISGHVDVAIRDPQGNIIEQVSVSKSSPFLKYRKRISLFKVSFSSVPPIGSTILVGFHKKKFKAYEIFACDTNVAIIEEVFK